MDVHEQKAIENIEKYGCHILHVGGDSENPLFSYSVGIEKSTGEPELVITGLKHELTHWMINEYNRRIKNGESFQVDKPYEGFIEGFEVVFKVVEKKHYREYFGWNDWFYKGDSFTVLQLIYPTTSGVWIWDDDASEEYLWGLPKLFLEPLHN